MSGVYEFGRYRLDIPARQLRRDDEPLSLTPKAFDLLIALIERRDRVVDKAELMRLVWPDSFVEEANLSQTIFVLRKTLGDDAAGRPFIDTVPRRGYRFAAEVHIASDAPRRSRTIVWGAAAVGAVVVASLTAATWSAMRERRATADALAGKTRLVVLPFENLTGDRKDDWLGSAFSDSLTVGLQDDEDLICVSRDRIVELYAQQSVKEASPVDARILRLLSQTLGVRYYVHGTYQKLGEQIKVVAQLVETESGTIRAQESVTDVVSSVLKMEDELATRFATRLHAHNVPISTRSTTSSVQAYQAFIEGRNAYAAYRLNEAIDPLTRATAIDPQYAEAWAALSKVNSRLSTVQTHSSGSIEQFHRNALAYAHRAIELAPSMYDAHVALALAYRETGDLDRWRIEARKAIELNPRMAEGYELLADSYFASNVWGCNRDRDAALAEEFFDRAIRIDPRSMAAYVNLSYHFSWLGRPGDALRAADQGLAALTGNVNIIRAKALALVRLGRTDEADGSVRTIAAGGASRTALDHLVLGDIAIASGDTARAKQEFETAWSLQPTTGTQLSIARAYLDNHRLVEGLSYIDNAVRMEPACAQFAATSPAFAQYRDAPQFRARLAAWKLNP